MSRPRAPQAKLAEAFRRRISDSRVPSWQMALVAGVKHSTNLAPILNGYYFPCTPATVEGLRRLAAALNYDGPVLVQEVER